MLLTLCPALAPFGLHVLHQTANAGVQSRTHQGTCRRSAAEAQKRQAAQKQKAEVPSVTVTDAMTVHQLASALSLKAVEVEDSLNGLGESVASHEDMCVTAPGPCAQHARTAACQLRMTACLCTAS